MQWVQGPVLGRLAGADLVISLSLYQEVTDEREITVNKMSPTLQYCIHDRSFGHKHETLLSFFSGKSPNK